MLIMNDMFLDGVLLIDQVYITVLSVVQLEIFYPLIWLQDPSHASFKEKMREFMANFDKNSDGRIEMSEVRNQLKSN